GGALVGIADAALGDGGATTGSGLSGTTALSGTTDVFGAARVLSAMSFADAAFPLVTLAITSVFTESALPDEAKSLASSRFFGALAATAARTAAMKPFLSNPTGLAPVILSAWAAFALASLSLAG